MRINHAAFNIIRTRLSRRLWLLCWVLVTSVHAMTVDFTAQPGQRSVANASGSAVPAGTFVWVGAVADDAQIVTSLSYATLRSLWLPFASTLTRTLGGEAGRFSASISGDEPDLSLRKIYLLVQQTTDGLAPTVDGSNVSQWGLYSSSLNAWRFPDNDNLPPGNATLITSSQVNQVWMGSITTNTLQLALQPTPAAAYAAWVSVAFAAYPNADASAQGDPDHDGLSNALECLFDTLPMTSNASVYRLVKESVGVTFRFPRNTSLPAGYERLEISTTLTGWAAPAAAQFTRSAVGNEVLFSFPLADNGSRLFFRLVLPWVQGT
jgi:hypothetical protein